MIKSLNFMEVMALGKELGKLSGIPDETLISVATNLAAGQVPGMAMAASAAAPAAPAPDGKKAEAPAQDGKKPEGKDKAPPKKEAKATSSLKLVSFPEGAKFNVLREVRKLKPGMNLMDSKKLVENLPQIIQKDILAEEQKEWTTALEGAGAKIEWV
uniref:Large ribosomal subunit protein bL12 C-terminal domain-containing protein n=1 Tax=Arcella intermedia TaxID=1963864 RepID=A0A6B2LM87_9EUKA